MKLADHAVISEDAMELLSCFYSGLDKIVYRLALVAARRRIGDDSREVEIEKLDVEEAGKLIIEHLQGLDANNEFAMLLHGSKTCFESKTKR